MSDDYAQQQQRLRADLQCHVAAHRRCKPEDVSVSDFGVNVARIVSCLCRGLHNAYPSLLAKADWSSEHRISIAIRGELATYDFNLLTRLVVMCHDLCIRVSVSPHGPKHLQLMFHPRQREGGMSDRHPTIEEHIKTIREMEY